MAVELERIGHCALRVRDVERSKRLSAICVPTPIICFISSAQVQRYVPWKMDRQPSNTLY